MCVCVYVGARVHTTTDRGNSRCCYLSAPAGNMPLCRRFIAGARAREIIITDRGELGFINFVRRAGCFGEPDYVVVGMGECDIHKSMEK